jgi:histidinol-phosphate aminotransferase
MTVSETTEGGLTIRLATEADGPLLVAMVRELAVYEKLEHQAKARPEDFVRDLFGPSKVAEAVVAEVGGVPVGFALYFFTYSTFEGRPTLYLEDLYVRPEHRKHGHGKALLLGLARRAVERGCARMEWAVLDWNAPSIAFYRSIGARPMDDWTTYRLDGPALERAASGRPLGDVPTPSYFRPTIDRMSGYVPGEQPKPGAPFIKLNTNENPYPPSPAIGPAIAAALADGRLRKYPDPVSTPVREAAARLNGVDPSWILAGNGSDDLLTIVFRAFAGEGDRVVYPTPTYILYRTLCELQAAQPVEVAFEPDWSLRPETMGAVVGARLAVIANPNSPSGTALRPEAVAAVARALPCPLVVDEAYADFAATSCLGLVESCPNVIVMRTLSKGYGLAGLRLGYLVARPEIVAGLEKVKDSYNCDALSQLGGAAALDDRAYLVQTRAKIVATRARLTAALRGLGYTVPESQANFVWCPTGPKPAVEVYEALKERRILVRLMRYDRHEPGLRITVGTDQEIDRLLEALGAIL